MATKKNTTEKSELDMKIEKAVADLAALQKEKKAILAARREKTMKAVAALVEEITERFTAIQDLAKQDEMNINVAIDDVCSLTFMKGGYVTNNWDSSNC